MKISVGQVGLRVRSHGFLFVVALQALWLIGSSARAATYVVTANEDEPDAAPGDGVCASVGGVCTLRAAVDEANASAGFDHIYLVTGDYRLVRGPLVVTGQLELASRNANWTTLDGNHASRVLELVPRAGESAYLRLVGLTLANGFAGAADPRGGAVLSDDPGNELKLERCIVRDNFAAGAGGGIYNAGSLDVSRSSITGNTSDPAAVGDPAAAGGGIYNIGSVTLSRSSLEHNAAVRGGGLANDSGTVSIWNVTFGGNQARLRGGAISNGPGALGAAPFTAISFSTLAHNQAGDDSGASPQPGQAGGIYNAGALQLTNSILALNTDLYLVDSPDYAPDCVSETLPGQPPDAVSVTSLGGNVWDVLTDRCAHAAGPSDQRGTVTHPLDPGLSDSTYSRPGELTFGYEPQPGSIVLDAAAEGGGAFCIDQDQWGLRRPGAGSDGATPHCDSGAIERFGILHRRTVMMIVGNRSFVPTDLVLAVKLSDIGFDIVDETASELTDEVREDSLALISETVTSTDLPSWLSSLAKPILSLEPAALDELGMTQEGWDRTQGAELGATRLNIHAGGPIDLGFTGDLTVTDAGAKFAWGVPATCDAFKVAELATAPGHWAVFGYDAGARLADGSRAPAARAAFFAAEGTPQLMNENGWNLFAATVNYLVP